MLRARRVRRGLAGVFGLVVGGVFWVAPGASGVAVAPVPVVVIDGRGFGHGVGMAQEGAFSMASAGASTEAILAQFYPGTTLGRGRGAVRVPVLDAGPAPSSTVLGFPQGGELREGNGDGPASPGFPVHVGTGGVARVSWDGGRYRVEVAGSAAATASPTTRFRSRTVALRRVRDRKRGGAGGMQLISYTRGQVPTLPPPPSTTTTPATTSTTSTLPATTTTPTTTTPTTTTTTSPATTTTSTSTTTTAGDDAGLTTTRTVIAVPATTNGTVAVAARQRRYRGVIEATAASGSLRFVNELDVEDYLKGMGEVRDPSWPPAALRAQAIAARTYALRAMAKGGELCDTQRCQVYLGAQAEYPQMNAAVAASAQKVLAYKNGLASAVYSANAGGYSASREEGFGLPPATDGDYPYLRPAPYPSRDQAPWSVTIALTDVAARLGYPAGKLRDVRVTRTGPSGRALEVVLDGDAGPRPVTGVAFDAALGLRSALFITRVDLGEPTPLQPANDLLLQAPPDEAAALAATEVAVADDDNLAALDELYAAAGAASTARPSTAPGDDGHGIDPRAAVLGSWMATACLGGLGVIVSDRRRRRRLPTPCPSPSAPPEADGSA